MLITENDIRLIIKEVLNEIFKTPIKYLYHKSNYKNRNSILKKGLIPSVGASYLCHYDDNEKLTPYIFMYDINSTRNGEYDTTFDDDIWAIDVSKLNLKHLKKDPDTYLKGCFVYDLPIPTSAISLLYQGSDKDSWDKTLEDHSYIYKK